MVDTLAASISNIEITPYSKAMERLARGARQYLFGFERSSKIFLFGAGAMPAEPIEGLFPTA
jgi:hypothetical protein